MGFLEGILAWLVEKVLSYLLGRAVNSVTNAVKDMEKDKERGKINDENVKKYEEASDRKSRIDAALGLLNRNKP